MRDQGGGLLERRLQPRRGRAVRRWLQQQDQGIDRVLRSMNGIFLTVEQAAAVSREVSEQAQRLNALAAELRREVAE